MRRSDEEGASQRVIPAANSPGGLRSDDNDDGTTRSKKVKQKAASGKRYEKGRMLEDDGQGEGLQAHDDPERQVSGGCELNSNLVRL